MTDKERNCNIFCKGRDILFDAVLQRINIVNEATPNIKDILTLKGYNKEVASIIMRMNRQTGATTWMWKKAIALIQNEEDVLIVALKEAQRDGIIQHIFEYCEKHKIHITYASKNEIRIRNTSIFFSTHTAFDIKGLELSYVFVDCSDFFPSNQNEKLTNSFTGKMIVYL